MPSILLQLMRKNGFQGILYKYSIKRKKKQAKGERKGGGEEGITNTHKHTKENS